LETSLNKTIQRLLVFFLTLPLFVVIVVVLPQFHHLAFNLVAVILSALGAVEFSTLLTRKNLSISKKEAAFLGALPPSVMIIIVNLDYSELMLSAVIAAVVVWLLVSGVFYQGDILDKFLYRLAGGFAVLLYPGMLMAWVVRMSRWEQHANTIILTFLAVVFTNDAMAWAMGLLFGKGNQGLVPASPKKSVAGFIGGIISSIIVGLGAALLFPHVFVPRYNFFPAAGALLGLLTGVAATFGDLGESAIKRSADLKDSGSLIPGRGGVLDSIDSIALAAPVFYLALSQLFLIS